LSPQEKRSFTASTPKLTDSHAISGCLLSVNQPEKIPLIGETERNSILILSNYRDVLIDLVDFRNLVSFLLPSIQQVRESRQRESWSWLLLSLADFKYQKEHFKY
jgi:hypothetical protein